MPGPIKGPFRAGPFKGAWNSKSPQRQFNFGWNANLRVTQISLEAWAQASPNLRVTQAGLEPWFQATPSLQVTQIGLEVWISIKPASISILPRAELGPKGFLGIPPRKFRERTLDSFVFATPPPIQTIVIPGNHLGPNGLLGIPVRKFRERSDTPYWNAPPFIPPFVPDIVIPKDRIGPKGLLGIPVRRFRERTLPILPVPAPVAGRSVFFWAVT